MNYQRGFMSLGLLLMIVVGVAVIGGGVYYMMQKQPAQKTTSVRWDIGSKVDDNFNNARITLNLPNGSVKTADIQVRNDCKELNQQNLNDEWIKKVDAGAVFEKEPTVIKPGLACVSWDSFSWYGVFFEGGKYYVKQVGDDASGLGMAKWKIIKEI
ncbi:hypothetical protein EXS62_00865 [Candidatus Kaiserbacteria bacterium]|nr:hypothetical protein [Candidatus Kaiserbacteria bacterium]